MNRLDVITTDPPNAGTPLRVLDGESLDTSLVYMRNNFPLPSSVDRHVEIEIGETDRRLDVADLKDLPRTEVEMVLECAGNGRIFMDPVPPGTPWDLGGASPVTFEGVPLLGAVGEIPDAIEELVFTGSDSGYVEPEGTVNYQFSLGREFWDRAILADTMAGEPLPKDHGGPVRLVVPGQYAMKSVKWLRSIVGTTKPFDGYFVNKYRYFGDDEMPEGAPVGAIQVRSIVATPETGETVRSGAVTIAGAAWTGTGTITAVDLSLDEGVTWSPSVLEPRPGHTSATSWKATIDLAKGDHEVIVRARDSAGNTQPLSPRWNGNGYANNVVHRVAFSCV